MISPLARLGLVLILTLSIAVLVASLSGIRGLLVLTGIVFLAFPAVVRSERAFGNYRLSRWQELAMYGASLLACASGLIPLPIYASAMLFAISANSWTLILRRARKSES